MVAISQQQRGQQLCPLMWEENLLFDYICQDFYGHPLLFINRNSRSVATDHSWAHSQARGEYSSTWPAVLACAVLLHGSLVIHPYQETSYSLVLRGPLTRAPMR